MIFMISLPAWATDYLIEDGDNFANLILVDYDTLLMTGGEGYELVLGDWSIATIENTEPLIDMFTGGIWEIGSYGYSELSNVRASGKNEAANVRPARKMSLEATMEYTQVDEFVEICPNSIRIRKKLLKETDRRRQERKNR